MTGSEQAALAFRALVSNAGQGGTGDTWHFKDLKNGRDVAVKFIKRPLPKVLQTNILREFTVSGLRLMCCCSRLGAVSGTAGLLCG